MAYEYIDLDRDRSKQSPVIKTVPTGEADHLGREIHTLAGASDPGTQAEEITPDDDNDLSFASRGIYVGSTGDLAVITSGGDTVTFSNVPGGAIFPISVTRVLATGTTANNLVALR